MPSSPAPTLETERIILRGHRADDLEPLAAMWADPEVYRMIGGQPRSREEVWLRLLRSVGQWTLLGYGAWIVCERSTGRLLGDMGLIEARRAIDPPLTTPEMGWVLVPGAQGLGFAIEAMTAILGWADDHAIGTTCCIIDPANLASIRLAERLGYMADGKAVYREHPTRVFTRVAASRPEHG